MPADFHLDELRGVVLARLVVVTDGEAGFGPIGNSLVVRFLTGDTPNGAERAVTLMDNSAYIFTPAGSQVPSVWRYQPPGSLAMAIAPGTYDGLAIAYPDSTHQTATPDSIPIPSRSFIFAPVEFRPGAIVYVGDIQIDQHYGFIDMMLDRVEVDYSVRDNYDSAGAELRARYPQLAEVPVERHVAQPTTHQ